MSKKCFTNEQITLLSNNRYVKKVSSKAITYTDEFKLYVIAESLNGKATKEIFIEAGFDPQIIGVKRISSSICRWRKSYKESGVMGLRDTRRENSGRPRTQEASLEEQLVRKNIEIDYLKAELELVKKLELDERQVKNNKLKSSYIFELIHKTICNYKLSGYVKHICDIASVSRSGYYNYLSKLNSRVIKENDDLKSKDIILKAFNHRGYKKGSRSIKMLLENAYGIIFNRKKIQRIMRKYNIICPIRRANPRKQIAKATKEHSVVPNKLNREFKQSIPGKVLLTDITYIKFKDKFAYLSTIKDASTNEILAYNLSKSLRLEIVLNTVDLLMKNTSVKLSKDAFIHSDQGSHYTSPRYQKHLKNYALDQSMSRRGNCWDNAPMESFFGHMKDEIDLNSCSTFDELKAKLDDYMEYYNNHRYQWNLKKLTPVKYRNQLLAA